MGWDKCYCGQCSLGISLVGAGNRSYGRRSKLGKGPGLDVNDDNGVAHGIRHDELFFVLRGLVHIFHYDMFYLGLSWVKAVKAD